jgi:AAA15 family ATPase/GTPase
MLVRMIVKNLYSFRELTEFNMLTGRFNRLPHHVYKTAGIELLKLNALYGANGAGKSNMVHTLKLLKDFLMTGELPLALITQTFKFDSDSSRKDVYIGIEFIKNETPYYYGLTINQGIIIEEELQLNGLGKKEDITLFSRTDSASEKKLEIQVSSAINANEEAALFFSFLKNELLERNKPVLFYMKNRQNEIFAPYKAALEWFDRGLEILLPDAVPGWLPLKLERIDAFYNFSRDIMRNFNTGIKDIHIDTIAIEDFFGEDNKQEAERISAEIRANPDSLKSVRSSHEEVVFTQEKGKIVAKRLSFSHDEDNGNTRFMPAEESDGTRKLLDYLPALYAIIHSHVTFLIDEIERSIHPLLIKELIRKFSHDTKTKGQLIFSTHESNLLDQEIFRPDEIWFAEKNKEGATGLYPLSDFKEHHTIDIRKGYLSGRYGAIPFLGNLKDLNWDVYAETNQI